LQAVHWVVQLSASEELESEPVDVVVATVSEVVTVPVDPADPLEEALEEEAGRDVVATVPVDPVLPPVEEAVEEDAAEGTVVPLEEVVTEEVELEELVDSMGSGPGNVY
jgi:hypothetical protein